MTFTLWFIEGLVLLLLQRHLGLGWWVWPVYSLCILLEISFTGKVRQFLGKAPQIHVNCPLAADPARDPIQGARY